MSWIDVLVLLVSLLVIVAAAIAIAVVLLAPDDADRDGTTTVTLRDDGTLVATPDSDLEDLAPLSRVRHRNPRLDGS